jgi:hypothetical protein
MENSRHVVGIFNGVKGTYKDEAVFKMAVALVENKKLK